MTLAAPFAHSSSNRQMGCCTSRGPKKLGIGRGGFSFLEWEMKLSESGCRRRWSQLQCQQNHCRYCSLCTLRNGEKAAFFRLRCFLSFYCMNSPRIHINITFSPGLNQVMNNKSKQQLPSMVPVKFHVLILRDCECFFHSFLPRLYEMWLDIWSLSAAQLPALQTGMGQW